MGPGIELKQLSLTLGENRLLQPMDLYLEAGKLHLLTGANGAGKSSLLKCMAGLMPHSGEVLRHWPAQKNNRSKQTVAYIPQLEAFDATLPITIRDYLNASIHARVFFRRINHQQQARIDQILAQVGLSDKQDRKLSQLSGGERQRLLFARALAQEAKLWFLDEPMTGLDQEAQAQIQALILRLKAQGCTLIMVHHGDAFVQQYADQVIEVSEGLKRVFVPNRSIDDPVIHPVSEQEVLA